MHSCLNVQPLSNLTRTSNNFLINAKRLHLKYDVHIFLKKGIQTYTLQTSKQLQCFIFSALENLWEGLDEPEFNVDEFEDTFSKASIKKKATLEKQASLHKAKEV